MFPSDAAEFRIAAAGPVVSGVIAAAFGGLTLVGQQIAWGEAVQGVVDYLWRINALVLGFNLVPALPLDGGRILRAWLWHKQKSFSAATVSAAKAGKAFGGLLIAVGLLNFLAGGATGGLWFVLLGWFLTQAAQAEASMALARDAMNGRRVRDLMMPQPDVVRSETTVEQFFGEAVRRGGHSTYPVVQDEQLLGVVSLRAAGDVPASQRAQRTVGDVMVPKDKVAVLHPETEMTQALDVLQEEPRCAPVMEDGNVVGLLSISDVARALEIEEMRGTRQEPQARRAGLLVWIVVGAIMLAAAAWLYHPPLVVVEPGPTADVGEGIEITGARTDRPNGKYLLTSVRVERPNALEAAVAAATGDDIVPLSQVIPPGANGDEFVRRQREIFEQSRLVAAAAAARSVGMPVSVEGSGAVVRHVVEGAPAAEELESGDVIVAVNGQSVRLAGDLQQAIRSRPVGTGFTLTIERSGTRRDVEVTSARLPEVQEGAFGIGVVVSTRDFAIDLPFEISFKQRPIGGPSAGLVYALAIADILDRKDYAQGQTIAATGTVDVDGSVGRIGGLEAKAEAVDDVAADVFLVPEAQLDGLEKAGLDVRGVADVEEALDLLSGRA